MRRKVFRCPYCNGLTNKAGFNDKNEQRYRCRKCGRRSTEHTPQAIQCSYCGSYKTIKSGFTKLLKQRYYCKSCNKTFIDREIVYKKCRICGADMVKAGKTNYGTQRYLCKGCGRKLIEHIDNNSLLC